MKKETDMYGIMACGVFLKSAEKERLLITLPIIAPMHVNMSTSSDKESPPDTPVKAANSTVIFISTNASARPYSLANEKNIHITETHIACSNGKMNSKLYKTTYSIIFDSTPIRCRIRETSLSR